MARRGAASAARALHGGACRRSLRSSPAKSMHAASGALVEQPPRQRARLGGVLHVERGEQRVQPLLGATRARRSHQRQRPHAARGAPRASVHAHAPRRASCRRRRPARAPPARRRVAQHVELPRSETGPPRYSAEKPWPGRSSASTRGSRLPSSKKTREKPFAEPPRPCTSTTGGPALAPSAVAVHGWPSTVTPASAPRAPPASAHRPSARHPAGPRVTRSLSEGLGATLTGPRFHAARHERARATAPGPRPARPCGFSKYR